MKTNTLWHTCVCATAMLMSLPVEAQEEKRFTVTPSADLVSSYVWRGMYQTGPAFQPGICMSVSGLSLSAWGSTDFDGAKEFDVTLGYEAGGFSIAVTDYWWSGEGARYGRYSTDHFFEGTVGYNFGDSFPLSLTWNTMFAGGDKDEDGDRNFSTYIEAAYSLDIMGVGVTPAIGITPWEGMYGSGFGVPSISLKVNKDVRITDSFSLPLFTQAIVSPEHDDVFLVFGISF